MILVDVLHFKHPDPIFPEYGSGGGAKIKIIQYTPLFLSIRGTYDYKNHLLR